MTKHNEELASHAAELLDMIRSHQYGLRGFGDGSLSRGRNLTDKERYTIEQALRLATAGEQKPVDIGSIVSNAMRRYLRVCSSGGMSTRHIKIVQANVDEAERLGYFKLAIAEAILADRARQQPEQVAQDKIDAELFRSLIPLLEWDGHGYWLPEACVKERQLGGDSVSEPTIEELREAVRAARARREG